MVFKIHGVYKYSLTFVKFPRENKQWTTQNKNDKFRFLVNFVLKWDHWGWLQMTRGVPKRT